MPTVAEIKAQHALLKQGNQRINPPELPKPEDTKVSPTATLRAEAEAARAQSLAEKDSLAGDPVFDPPQIEVELPPPPAKRKPGRPRKATTVAEALAPIAEQVKVGQAAPETRSSWTLGDLQRMSEELASHGIVITFSFKEVA